jgi:Secretion system C-terminal sorting domain
MKQKTSSLLRVAILLAVVSSCSWYFLTRQPNTTTELSHNSVTDVKSEKNLPANALTTPAAPPAAVKTLQKKAFYPPSVSKPNFELKTEENAPVEAEKANKLSLTRLKSELINEHESESLEERAMWAEERVRHEWNMAHDPKTGKIPRDAQLKAIEAAKTANEFRLPSVDGKENGGTITLVGRGPTNYGGRTRAVGIDVRNSNIIIAGCVSGGTMRTTDGGNNWTRVSPTGQIHNVTTVAQDPRSGSQDTWYYGGGEASGNSASIDGNSSFMNNGIWKSTDNGATWTILSNTQSTLETFNSGFDFTHRLAVDPTNGNVYAAASNTIRRSTDGGATWSIVLGSFANNGFTDIIITPSGRLYAAFQGDDTNEGVWTSTTGASGSWTKIAGTISSVVTPATWNAASGYGRVVLAYAPSATNIVYALYYNNTLSSCSGTAAPEAKLFKYDQSTSTWTNLSANLPNESGCLDGNDPFACQGGYDLCVAVKPNDANTVFIGGTNVYRSTDGFTTTTNTKRIGGYVSASSYGLYANHHPDIHYLTFATGDNNTLYTGTDGGVHKGDITATTVAWTSLNNNYVTYQYYHTDINPNSTSVTAMAGGAQDNGTKFTTSGTSHTDEWSGDGCQVQFVQFTSTSNYNMFVSSQQGSIYRNTATTATNVKPSGSASGNSAAFVTYFHLDPDNTNYLYYAGANSIYRTRIASTIAATTVGSNSAAEWELLSGLGASGKISYMATSRNNSYGGAAYSASNTNRVLYIGTETGNVYRLDDPAFAAAATAAVSIKPSSGSGYVSCIAVNPFNDSEVMLTYSNYGASSVFHTTNAKSATPTWTVVEGPSSGAVTLGSARSCLITRFGATTTYLVGNSTGLFCTQVLSGATTVWDRVGSTDINYAVCSSMRLRVTDNKAVLGTHGNGMFELQMPAVLPVELLSFDGKTEAKSNLLTWKAANEIRFSGYQMERSDDGKTFKKLGFVTAKNTIGEHSYAFEDTEKSVLSNSTPQYYRLKMMDIGETDGQYSKIITLQRTFAQGKAWQFVVSPNPTSSDLTVDFEVLPETPSLSVQVMDIAGRVFTNFNKQVADFGKLLTVPTANLPSGTYFLRLQTADGVVKMEKFVKQ